MSSSRGFSSLDLFRKVPLDLTEATSAGKSHRTASHPHPLDRAHTTPPGALLSLCAVSFMALLFSVELMAFVSVASQTQVLLDTNSEQHLRINFNVTLMDLHCDYAAVDVVDVLGTNSMNVTSHIDKWLLNSDGVRMLFHGRNREQKDIAHDDHLHPDIETLHENGEHAVPVGDKSFDQFVGENPCVGGGAAAAATSTDLLRRCRFHC